MEIDFVNTKKRTLCMYKTDSETGAKVLEFNTAHNISQKEFDKGTTYIDIYRKNIEVLKEALN